MFSTAVNIYQHKPEVINWRLVSKVLKHTDYYFPLISFLSFTNVTSVHDCLNDLQLKDFTWLYTIRRTRWWLNFTFGWTVLLMSSELDAVSVRVKVRRPRQRPAASLLSTSSFKPASLKRAAFKSDRRVTERRWHDVCRTTQHSITQRWCLFTGSHCLNN